MKVFVTLPALALLVAFSGSAFAENGVVNEATLQAMGLSGIQVMSDDAALAIRGKGYMPMTPPVIDGSEKPWSLASGFSYANVGGASLDEYSVHGTGAGTIDGFVAEGQFMASGEHFSEAGRTVTKSVELQVKGAPATLEIRTRSIHVFAGGFATASSL